MSADNLRVKWVEVEASVLESLQAEVQQLRATNAAQAEQLAKLEAGFCKVMFRLTELLDENQFPEFDRLADELGITPPANKEESSNGRQAN